MLGQAGRNREILQEIVERIGWVYAGLWQPSPSNNRCTSNLSNAYFNLRTGKSTSVVCDLEESELECC
ncbi:hypothetical protein R1sor_013048 [Riccia sorocarpa]|uniref:Uncharacterized protein n=1 Tax=Riccia sorocarpa TaxID=122646 RepID=A0ABD3H9B4_9MARC